MHPRSLLAAVALLLGSAAHAQTFTGSDFGPIPDGLAPGPQAYGAPRDITFNVSGIAGTVTGVGVAFRASHPYVGDLKVSLIAPNGRTHLLFERTGSTTGNVFGSSANLVATSIYSFVDAHIINWWTAAVIGGDVPSTEARSVISGGAGVSNPPAVTAFNTRFALVVPNGIWRLRFEDGATGDTGDVTAATLILTVAGTTRTVTKIADTNDGTCDSDCSLREAVTAAQNGDLINFSSLFDTPQHIDLTSALPVITRSIAIQGPGAQLLTVRRAFTAASDFRVFDIPGGVTNGVAISGMTISNGRTTNFGGGILSRSRLSLSGVHIAGNTATLGGGVFLGDMGGAFSASTFSGNVSTGDGGGLFFEGNNGDVLTVANSTVSGNHSAGNSGGIRTTRGQLELTNSTVVDNTASSSPGGVLAIAQTAGNTSTVTLRSSIVSGNAPNNFAAVSVGGTASIQSQDFNLSDNYNSVFTPLASDLTSATPRLAPLALYSGTTPTHALLQGSPALNVGDASGQLLDQRDQPRVFGTRADIGAVEMRPRLVSNDSDSGVGSLRNAITASNGSNALDDILFDSTFFSTPRTVTLTSGELVISSPINIIAPGANLLTVSGNNASRVFQITTAATASLNGLTITGGNGAGGGVINGAGGGILSEGRLSISFAAIIGNTASSFGGGIYASSNAVSNIARSTISGNSSNAPSTTAGGIQHIGTLTVIDSTISGNSVNQATNSSAGGLWINRRAQIVNTTIANNSVPAGGANASGVFVFSASSASLRNSIVVGNSVTLPDLLVNNGTVSFVSHGFNLIGNPGTVSVFTQIGDQSGTSAAPLNPLLAPLANNGGTTQTHALLAGSPALDKGERSGANTDQRGSQRPFDLASISNTADGSDIGALEAQSAPDTVPIAAAQAADITSASGTTFLVNVTYTDDAAIDVSTLNDSDIRVTGPNGFSSNPPSFFLTGPNSNGTPRTASYLFSPPGGSWDIGDNGSYTISMNANQVSDLTGNFVPAGVIGTFVVNIPPEAPTVSYTPNAGSTINFPAGAAGPANSTINLTSSGGSGTGSITVNNCVASSGFTLNGPINLIGTPNSPINGAIISSCTRGAGAQSGTLSCTETPTPGSAVTRSWTLNCPAADTPNVPPNLAYAPAANSTINYGAAGTAAAIIVTPSGGSGSGIEAQTLLGACQIFPGGAAFPNTSIAQLSFVGNTTTPQNLNLPNCVPQAGNAVNATLSCPESLGGAPPTTRSWTLTCPAAQAAGLLVTNTNDSGPGSLRQAILDANNNGPGTDDISFSSLFNTPQSITLSQELVASSDMTILGPSAALLSLSGNHLVRVLRVDSGVVNVTGITFTRGNSGALPGGALRINGGEVTLLECQVTDSRASDGAGILNDGSLTLERVLFSGNSTTAANEPNVGGAISSGGVLFVGNSTFSANSAQASTRAAGAVLIYGGTASINNSTITNNSATNASTRIGGILQFAGTLTLRSSIVASNVSNATIPDIGGAMTASFNLIGNAGTAAGLTGNNNQSGTGASPLNPLLGPLANNGGRSLTHALSAGSPALDAGSNVLARTRDQRGTGFARLVDLAATNVGDGTDIGALEAQSEPLADRVFRNGFE